MKLPPGLCSYLRPALPDRSVWFSFILFMASLITGEIIVVDEGVTIG
jgi:hypothetical protein